MVRKNRFLSELLLPCITKQCSYCCFCVKPFLYIYIYYGNSLDSGTKLDHPTTTTAAAATSTVGKLIVMRKEEKLLSWRKKRKKERNDAAGRGACC